jgi:hypothetical protein
MRTGKVRLVKKKYSPITAIPKKGGDDEGPVGVELFDAYKERCGDSTVLAFSCGKDSIAMALSMRDHVDLKPVYYYCVPDLPMIEESLDYYERKLFGGQRIARYPNQLLYDWLENGTYQSYDNLRIWQASKIENPHEDLDRWYNGVRTGVIEATGIDERALIGVGVKARDSPMRWMSFQKHGSIRINRGSWYPIWNYSQDMLLETIRKSDVKLPVDYHLFGRSFDGLDIRYLLPLKKHRPEDYRKIIEWFPLAEAEVFYYEKTLEGSWHWNGPTHRG